MDDELSAPVDKLETASANDDDMTFDTSSDRPPDIFAAHVIKVPDHVSSPDNSNILPDLDRNDVIEREEKWLQKMRDSQEKLLQKMRDDLRTINMLNKMKSANVPTVQTSPGSVYNFASVPDSSDSASVANTDPILTDPIITISDISAAHAPTPDDKIKTSKCVARQKDIPVSPISLDGFTIVRSRRLRRPTNSPPRHYLVRQLTHDAIRADTLSPVNKFQVIPPKTLPPHVPLIPPDPKAIKCPSRSRRSRQTVMQKVVLTHKRTPTPESQLALHPARHSHRSRQTERSRRFLAARRSMINSPAPSHSPSPVAATV